MRIPLFDAHCDSITADRPIRRNTGHLDLERLTAYIPAGQVFALWEGPNGGEPGKYGELIAQAKAKLAENGDTVSLCTSAQEIEAAEKSGKTAALLSAEGAGLFGCTEEGLLRAFADGVRIVHLTWNNDNTLAGAAMDSGAGLSGRGRRFVHRAQELGAVLDMSHISEAAFWDVVDITSKPILAGHSNSKALCRHPRNLTDGQFRAIAELGGCVGLNLCADFLGGDPDIDTVLGHAEHFLELGGERCLCLGCDFDGVDALPRGISGVQDLEKIYSAMLRRGWGERLAAGIFRDNLRDFFGRAL